LIGNLCRGGPFGVRPGVVFGLLALALLLGPSGAARSVTLRGPIADSVRAAASGLDSRAIVGALAVSLDRGDTLLAGNEGRRFIPGSNTKLFTTAAFLRRYGAGARFATRLEARGKVGRKREGVVDVEGDLVLRPAGVPDVTQILAPGSRGLLDSLAFLLRAGGLARFEGTLWVDGTLFADDPWGPGWALEDVPHAYGAVTGPVLANGNAATVIAEGGSGGVRLSLDPPETPLTLVSEARVVEAGTPGGIDAAREQGSRVLRVLGAIPRGGVLKKQVAVPDPDSAAGLWLLGAMRRAGIEVRKARVRMIRGEAAGAGGGRDRERRDDVPPAAAAADTGWSAVRRDRSGTVVALLSPTASAMVGVVHALSLNAESEALLRHLDPAPRGKRRGAGLVEARRAAAEAAGVDTLDLSLVDGSGLSPQNLATPRSLVAWLAAMARDSALASPFRDGLASPGEGGTLKRRFTGLDPRADLRAKTGTLTNVSSLAGYVTGASGERVAFAVITNGNRGSTALGKQLEERVVEMLARRGGGDAGALGSAPPRIPR